MRLPPLHTHKTEDKLRFGSVRIKNSGSGIMDIFTETPTDGLFLNDNEKPLTQKPAFDVTELYQKRAKLTEKVQKLRLKIAELAPFPEGTDATLINQRITEHNEAAEEFNSSNAELAQLTRDINEQLAEGFKSLTKAELKEISAEITDLDVRRKLRNYGLPLPKPLSERLGNATRQMKQWGAESIQSTQRLWNPWNDTPIWKTFSRAVAVVYALCILPIKLPIMAVAGFFWGFLET